MMALMQHNGLWGLGAVALLAVGLGMLYRAPVGSESGWRLSGDFENVGGLKAGSDVMRSGFAVGTVEDIRVMPDLQVRVTVLLEPGLEVPDDSDLRVQSAGLFGEPYLSLMLGGGVDLLVDGDQVAFTQSSVDFLNLFQKVVEGARKQDAPTLE